MRHMVEEPAVGGNVFQKGVLDQTSPSDPPAGGKRKRFN